MFSRYVAFRIGGDIHLDRKVCVWGGGGGSFFVFRSVFCACVDLSRYLFALTAAKLSDFLASVGIAYRRFRYIKVSKFRYIKVSTFRCIVYIYCVFPLPSVHTLASIPCFLCGYALNESFDVV